MQAELKKIGILHKSIQKGQAWHGKSLQEALDSLDYQQAAKAPFPGAHSVWRYVLHITAWRRFAIEKLKGNDGYQIEIGGNIDWPDIGEISRENWDNSCQALENAGQELRNSLSKETDALLAQTVSGKDYTFYILLHGIVQHDAYHCGQIVLTRKMLEHSSYVP